MLFSKLLKVWPVEDIEQLLRLFLAILLKDFGFVLLLHKEFRFDLFLKAARLFSVGGLLEGEEEQMRVQERSDLLESVC